MSRRGWVLFLAMSVIWGVPYLLIKVAVEEFPPVVVVFLRCVVGMVLLPFLLVRRYRNARMWWAIGGAALGVALPYLLFGAPGQQPYPVTSFLWYLVIGIGAVLAFSVIARNSTSTDYVALCACVLNFILFITHFLRKL